MACVDVCLISHGQPSSNPRLVRDSDALSEAGFTVRVVTPRFMSRWVEHDQSIVNNARWEYAPVDCLSGAKAKARWNYCRIRVRLAKLLFRFVGNSWSLSRAVNYANPELHRLAAAKPAHLYVAHQHHALPAAHAAAAKTGALLAFDAQDLLSECSSEPVCLMRALEHRYLPHCSYVSTMSDVAAERLLLLNRLARRPLVLHNTPRMCERSGILSPDERPPNDVFSLYWFGQSIGPHCCAEVVLHALARLDRPSRLTLRGHALSDYVDHLRKVATRLGLSSALHIAPVAPPREMVALAAEHDVLLGTQPGAEMFHQMAIGNKVFTGMMAGCALGLNDTVAHRRLVEGLPPVGFLYPDADPEALAKSLDRTLQNPHNLLTYKRNAWRMAEQRFNWGSESQALVSAVTELVGSRRKQ